MTVRTNSIHPAMEPATNPDFQMRLFYLGMTILRVGFGLVFLTNGIAKLPGQWDGIHPFPGFLITRDGARGILQADTQTHPVGIYKDIIDKLVLPNWGAFSVLLTVSELFVGICLVVGVLTPIAALIGAAFTLHLNFAVWDRNVWVWEYAVEWMALLAIALMRAGRYWGLDAKLARRLPRWPFT